jgi:ATP phosphoribosyltransferase regulatory subunit
LTHSIDNPTYTPIPQGVADYFGAEAQQRRQLEAQLLTTFRRWGYSDVIPPTFEYADTFTTRASGKLQSELYRFLDRNGRPLALRGDMTIAVARLVGTRLHDWPMPQRFCYAGSVFRYAEPQAGRQREFWQAGIELIGAGSAEADAEVLALLSHALTVAGLDEFCLVVGQIQYFAGLLQALQLAPAQQQALQHAIDRNSEAQLVEFLRNTPLPPQQRQALEALPYLSGSDSLAIIAQAAPHCLNNPMVDALENLRAICDVLEAYDVSERLYLDLTEIHNLGYYTGVTFEALTPALGFPIASGGRYDNLVGTFGHPQPAVGAALGLDRLLLAKGAQAKQWQTPRPVPPDLLVAANDSAACLRMIEEWRQQGVRVAIEVNGRRGAQLWQAACQLGAPCALTWTGAGFDLYSDPGELEQPARFVAVGESWQAIQAILAQRKSEV